MISIIPYKFRLAIATFQTFCNCTEETFKAVVVPIRRHTNSLIRSFVPLSLRSDNGGLFENWFVLERIKYAGNRRRFTGFYFWRTCDQHEIDLVEDIDGMLTGFECKWSPNARLKAPKDWLEAYPGARFEVVTQANWVAWLE